MKEDFGFVSTVTLEPIRYLYILRTDINSTAVSERRVQMTIAVMRGCNERLMVGGEIEGPSTSSNAKRCPHL
jgi:hypothetical protein